MYEVLLLLRRKKRLYPGICRKNIITRQKVLEVAVNILNITPFSKHQTGSAMYLGQLPKYFSSKGLYKDKRDICNNAYIGIIKRHLIVRQYEHLDKLIATDKPLTYSDKDATAIRKHCHSVDILASIDSFSKLINAMNNYHLSLKEYLLIFKLKSSLNVAKESFPLYLFDNDSENC